MKKYFYSHLIELDILETQLNTLNLTAEEKKELTELAHQNIHHAVMDAIFLLLKEEDKKRFLELLSEGEHDKVLGHLNNKVEKIEEKIQSAASEVKKELMADIKKLKNSKKSGNKKRRS